VAAYGARSSVIAVAPLATTATAAMEPLIKRLTFNIATSNPGLVGMEARARSR
jgi:hypothetical protein